jgi:hypothetical protein
MSTSLSEEIERLPYDAEGIDDWLRLIARITRTQDLNQLIDVYNWDDGFIVPNAVMEHRECDLGIALKMFWLSEAAQLFSDSFDDSKSPRQWIDFCRTLASLITTGTYVTSTITYMVPINSVAKRKLANRGVPAILYTDVTGETST